MNGGPNQLDWAAWVTGIVVGGVLGAVVALFSAPTSGEVIRERLWETSIDWRDRTEETAANYLAQFSPTATRRMHPTLGTQDQSYRRH
jgi:gas vesicle protein